MSVRLAHSLVSKRSCALHVLSPCSLALSVSMFNRLLAQFTLQRHEVSPALQSHPSIS